MNLKGTPIDIGEKLFLEYEMLRPLEEYNDGIYCIEKLSTFYFVACSKVGNKNETISSIDKNFQDLRKILIDKKLKSFSIMETDVGDIK